MIAKTNIQRNLRTLNAQYKKSTTTPKVALFLSKLAVLELCGWIEETMDDVLLRCAKKHLKDASSLNAVKELIKKNSGFHYEYNFRRVLVPIIGLVNVEKLELAVDQPKKTQMEAALASLKIVRNAHAHTHIRGMTIIINAPSWTIAQFSPVYEGLIELDMWLRSTNL